MEVVGLIVLYGFGAGAVIVSLIFIGSIVVDLFSRRDISKNIQPIVSASQQIKPSDVDWTQMRALGDLQSAQEARLRAQDEQARLQRQRDRLWNEMVDRQAMSSFNSGFASGVQSIAIGGNVTASSIRFGSSNNPLGDKKSKAKINKVFNQKFAKE